VNTGLVAGVNLLCFAIFWVLKMLLFNKIFHTDKLHDIEIHLEQERSGQHPLVAEVGELQGTGTSACLKKQWRSAGHRAACP